MKRNKIITFMLVLVFMLGITVWAASSVSQNMYVSGDFWAKCALSRNVSYGTVTATTTRGAGDGKVGVLMQVTDRTYGVISKPLVTGTSVISTSYTPPYDVTDTIGATSAHYLYYSTGSLAVSSGLTIP